MVVAGQGGVGFAALEKAIGIGQKQRLDGGEPLLRLALAAAGQHRLAQQGDQGVGLFGLPQPMGRKRFLGAGMHPLQLPNEHVGQVVERPRDLALEQRRHQRQPPGLDHPGEHVGGQAVRASAAKRRTLAAGTALNTAVSAPCSRSQSRWRRKSCMCRGVGRFGSVFTRSQAVRT